jgi:acylphosphatase
MPKRAVHVFITGRVQGVGYRYSTLYQAQNLGITGWVRNTYDGKVEAFFEGDEKAVDEMLKWCQSGPSMAFVSNIDMQRRTYTGEFKDFSIKS